MMSGNSIFRTALIDRAQKGIFSDEVTKSTFEDSLLALGELAAKCRDDETLDKWLYQAISRAAQLDQEFISQTALALVDVLRARLTCRKNPASFAAMALPNWRHLELAVGLVLIRIAFLIIHHHCNRLLPGVYGHFTGLVLPS